jgi:hypothetical protein
MLAVLVDDPGQRKGRRVAAALQRPMQAGHGFHGVAAVVVP